MISLFNVGVSYGAAFPVHAVQDVSLHLDAGEWAFLVGPSGAGKSTLLKLIYAAATASSGRVLVDGDDVTRLKLRDVPQLRRKIGVIFQDFQLLPQKTVWENVAFALQVTGVPQKRLVREVPRALDTVGLAMKQDKRPHELSGGEAQRVAIARAIVNRPRILLADEPTGNLDPDTAWDIAQVLQQINDEGTTVLMATHDRALVDAMRQRVVRLKNGCIDSDETPGTYHPEDGDLRAPGFVLPTPLQELDDEPAEPEQLTPTPAPVFAPPAPALPSRVAGRRLPPIVFPPAPLTPGAPTRTNSSAPPIGTPENPIVSYDE